MVDDAAHLKHALEEQLCSDVALRDTFLQSFHQFARQSRQLSKALRPTTGNGMVRSGVVSRSSFLSAQVSTCRSPDSELREKAICSHFVTFIYLVASIQ